MLPPFIVGGAGIAHRGWGRLLPWAVSVFGYFGLLHNRVMCSHCPHCLLGEQWFLLLVFVLAAMTAGTMMKAFFCTQGMSFACPLNATDEEAREAFFERNPSVASAWKRQP